MSQEFLQHQIDQSLQFVWVLFAALCMPLIWLYLWRQITPTRLYVATFIAPFATALVLIATPIVLPVIILCDLVLIVVGLVDVWSLPRRRSFAAARQCVRIASLGKAHKVEIEVDNLSKRDQPVTIRDDVPDELVATPGQFNVKLKAESRSSLTYEFAAQRRGAYLMETVHLRCQSRWGLWQRDFAIPVESRIHVYPDMKQLSEYAILARTNRLSLLGVRRTRRVGQDHDFERLRDYTLDDNYKLIDWRSTARRNKLTVRDYQTSQSQRIIFLIDCGRMMTNEHKDLNLLDYSFNAMLMLSFVALRQGDSVGLICFSDDIHNFVPPRGGMGQMNHLLHASFDRFPKLVESRYDQAFLFLDSNCKKRSLVVLMTNVLDEVNAFQVQQYLGNLVGKHLPLGVLIRDHSVFAKADIENPQGTAFYEAAAAAEILNWRHQVIGDLQKQGVMALDAFPESMTAPLVNQYLAIKARHLL
ncbi:MAG: DUF58 domain-containing protein [Pirellulaceae bacterium]